MYTNIYYNKKDNKIFLWDDEKGMIQFDYPRYAYKKSSTGTYKSLYGDTLEKVKNYDENDTELFESDIQPEMRVLLDAYKDSDEPSKGHKVIAIDIEVNSEGGFPDVSVGDKEITAIALYDFTTDKYFCYVLDPENKVGKKSHDNVEIIPCATEEELVRQFLNKWEEISPTIVTGWNTSAQVGINTGGFDIPYLYNRIKNTYGYKEVARLSPIRIIYQNKFNKRVTIAGVSCLDYMDLYKKFLGIMKPSYTLANVAKDEELKTQKLTYKGNLNDLYNTDLNRFVEYNLADVRIVVELDKKYDFIYLARSVCHKGHIPYEWFHMSSRFIDGAILMYIHRHDMIAPNKPLGGREEYEEMEKEGEEGFTGAYVKEPVPGIYDWIMSADITSLYPSVIMSLNISPDTKVGKIENWNYEEFHAGKVPIVRVGAASYTDEEFKEIIKDQAISISSNGVMYRQDTMGVVPSILDLWFRERIEYRELAKKYKKEGDTEKAAFYNRRQLRQKIFLNSVYGTLGLPVFRFYDRDNAEATTISGQTIIRSAEQLVNSIYHRKFIEAGKTPPEQDFVKYIDTDSVYISSVPLALCQPSMPNDMKKFTIDAITYIASEINGHYANIVPLTFNIKPERNRIKIVGDVVAKKAMWMAKKRYAMLKVFDMENMADVKDKYGNDGKVEVKGIDTVRSSYPAAFRKIASEVLDMLLRGGVKTGIDDKILKFEEYIDAVPIFDLGKTTSVKFVSQNGEHNYAPSSRKAFQFVKGTPVGVKSALAYNDLIKAWKLDKQVQPIFHSQKVKWIYLFPNEFNIDTISLKADDTDPDQILEFAEKYIDRQSIYEAELKSKLLEFYKVAGWEYPNRATELAMEFMGNESTHDW